MGKWIKDKRHTSLYMLYNENVYRVLRMYNMACVRLTLDMKNNLCVSNTVQLFSHLSKKEYELKRCTSSVEIISTCYKRAKLINTRGYSVFDINTYNGFNNAMLYLRYLPRNFYCKGDKHYV